MENLSRTSCWRIPSPLWTLCLFLVAALCMEPEYDYPSWNGGHTYGKPQYCTDIPEDLRLCRNVGYEKMLLPNLLDHESMAEVKQQAGSWVPLVHKACHPGTQVFLCSLFAPVCMERPVYPCRWLCEAVRDGCTPIMEAFGFPWPEMLTCSKFPTGDMCIAMNATSTPESPTSGLTPVCPPCDNEQSIDAVLEHMCASEFAIKTKVKEVRKEAADRKVILQKRKKLVKVGNNNFNKNELKKLSLTLKNGADCTCPQLDELATPYLIMGRKVGRQYLLTGIHKWDKSGKFRKALKKLKSHKCPAYEAIF